MFYLLVLSELILLMSIIDQDLRSTIENVCRAKGVPAASVLDPVVNLLTAVLGQSMTNLPVVSAVLAYLPEWPLLILQ